MLKQFMCVSVPQKFLVSAVFVVWLSKIPMFIVYLLKLSSYTVGSVDSWILVAGCVYVKEEALKIHVWPFKARIFFVGPDVIHKKSTQGSIRVWGFPRSPRPDRSPIEILWAHGSTIFIPAMGWSLAPSINQKGVRVSELSLL